MCQCSVLVRLFDLSLNTCCCGMYSRSQSANHFVVVADGRCGCPIRTPPPPPPSPRATSSRTAAIRVNLPEDSTVGSSGRQSPKNNRRNCYTCRDMVTEWDKICSIPGHPSHHRPTLLIARELCRLCHCVVCMCVCVCFSCGVVFLFLFFYFKPSSATNQQTIFCVKRQERSRAERERGNAWTWTWSLSRGGVSSRRETPSHRINAGSPTLSGGAVVFNQTQAWTLGTSNARCSSIA